MSQQAGNLFNPQRAADLYNQAAELATLSMKGKVAAMFYEKAETALSFIE